MALSSIFIYELEKITPLEIYNFFSTYSAQENEYFNLDLISDTELIGDYICVHSVEESFFDITKKDFSKRLSTKTNVTSFTINKNHLEIWSNKTNASNFIFMLSKYFPLASLTRKEISIINMINILKIYKAKISKVRLRDILITEDVIGETLVDLSSYGDSYAFLEKFKGKIVKMTAILSFGNELIRFSFTANGQIVIYRKLNKIDYDIVTFLYGFLTNRGV